MRSRLEKGSTMKGMHLSEFLFLIWAVGVSLFWLGSEPTSAPQQAALAGQALVLICIPYCVLSVFQRAWAARKADRERTAQPTLDLKTPLTRAK
jgi:hypothetical protein